MKKRLAAEWEPAIGVLMAYPWALPKELVIKLSHDTTIYFMCADQDAISTLKQTVLPKMGIDPKKHRYVVVPQGDDSMWPRDWGPHPLFDEFGNYALLGPRYVLATPHCDAGDEEHLYCTPWNEDKVPLSEFDGNTDDDLAAAAIARQIGTSFVKAPFAFTGGNVLNDGVNTIISTKVLLAENEYEGLRTKDYFDYVAHITGMTNYAVLSDYEKFSLNHIDCFLKILDEHRLLVERPPRNHELYPVYENIVENELRQTTNSYGEPWEIIPIDAGVTRNGEGIAAYVNSLILNKCVYVPMYGIATDESALETWRKAMPGYDVQGFTFEIGKDEFACNPDDLYGEIGWQPGDVLHCRTRAIWDPLMLHIDVPGPVRTPAAGRPTTIQAHIVAYSQAGLIEDRCRLAYRIADTQEFSYLPLKAGVTCDSYIARVPAMPAGTTIEYYVEAADKSGRAETSPRPAPEQFWSFTV